MNQGKIKGKISKLLKQIQKGRYPGKRVFEEQICLMTAWRGENSIFERGGGVWFSDLNIDPNTKEYMLTAFLQIFE
jgi:hypothetical protein